MNDKSINLAYLFDEQNTFEQFLFAQKEENK